jgi:hypothetical protein
METLLHRIKAHLYDNPLTKDDPNDFVARVNAERSLSVKEICAMATARGGADISAAAMEHAANLFLQEMGYQLCDGYSVNTGWFTAGVHIRGRFDNPRAHFDPAKHTLLFEFNQGALLRKELPLIKVDIEGVAESGIVILQVEDVRSGSVNDLLSPGRNLRITGNKIKIVGEAFEIGVFFTTTDNTQCFKVEENDIVVNNPSELIVVTPPALPPNTYYMTVTTLFNPGHILKTPRTGKFDKTLTVPAFNS